MSVSLQQLFQLPATKLQAAEIVLLILLKQALAIVLTVHVVQNFVFQGIELLIDVTHVSENIRLQWREVHDTLLGLGDDLLWDNGRFVEHEFFMLLS